MVWPCSGTRKRFFFAFSPPFRMASGTSLALPRPTPTWPLPSPTTTSAEKLNRRPPFTTLATRLMLTTRSLRSRSLGLIGVATPAPFLELEAGLAGGLRLLRHQPPHPLGVLLLVDLVLSLQLLGEARGERQGAPGGVVHHLGVDVLQALVDREPGPLGGAGELPPDAVLPLDAGVDAGHGVLVPSGRDGDLPRRMIGGVRLRGAGLAFLPAPALVGVLDALALVRLGRPQRPDLHRGLAQRLAVDAAKGQPDGGQAVLGARHLVHLGGDAL